VLGGHLLCGFHHFECVNLARVRNTGVGAHPATNATIKVAVLIVNSVLAI
jgi:hypothetical protein